MMETAKSVKVLLITSIPTPYRIPLFNELSKQFKQQSIQFKVVFGALGYSRRKWDIDMSDCNFNFEVLSSRKITLPDKENTFFTYKGVLSVIKKEEPSIIIITGFSWATTKLWFRSLFVSSPYLIWSGAILSKARPDSLLRKIHRMILLKRAKGFIAYGIKAKEYLISLGADPDEITIGINTVDTDFFRKKTGELRIHSKKKDKKELLFIGYLVKRKRVDLLFDVAKILIRKRQDFILRLIGDGPDLENLKALAHDLNLVDHVSFEGFKQKSIIPKYLAEADCFLFPSEIDFWGLVLVEAMAVGLPCISSIYAGATFDLIEDGVNGFVMDFSNTVEVADRINWILDNPQLSKEIGERARNFILENLSLIKSANGFIQAVSNALTRVYR